MTDQAFAEAMADIRFLLQPQVREARVWPVLAAALAFALCAMVFATAAIMAPPAHLTHISAVREAT
jgi:hypothetical protein